jgi:two-component system KDP operon response regulator KdpE
MANSENKHGEQLAQRRLALFGDECPKVIANAGRVMTHPHLLREVWGPTHSESTQYLRVYMGNLQQKLEDDSAQPKHIVTETGVGYRLLAD